jgi:hypothetical protein
MRKTGTIIDQVDVIHGSTGHKLTPPGGSERSSDREVRVADAHGVVINDVHTGMEIVNIRIDTSRRDGDKISMDLFDGRQITIWTRRVRL